MVIGLLKVKVVQCVLLSATPRIVRGILQARILEWVAFPFSRGSWTRKIPKSLLSLILRFPKTLRLRSKTQVFPGLSGLSHKVSAPSTVPLRKYGPPRLSLQSED